MSNPKDVLIEHCITFLKDTLQQHGRSSDDLARRPVLFVGINGMQGAGKTTLAAKLAHHLTSNEPPVRTAVLSIDDFYLKHDDQVKLAATHASNPMLQHRGQPLTHDIPLLRSTLDHLERQEIIRLPQYDKSAFSGQGDRKPEDLWPEVNVSDQEKIQAVILEGWCVGFRALSDEALQHKWHEAREAAEEQNYDGQLGKHEYEHIRVINDALKTYSNITNMLHAFIHLNANDLHSVYAWRLQQEAELREKKGTGMTDGQVIDFVNGYYPAYELYHEDIAKGVIQSPGGQLEICIDSDRHISKVFRV